MSVSRISTMKSRKAVCVTLKTATVVKHPIINLINFLIKDTDYILQIRAFEEAIGFYLSLVWG